jgi:TonB family protein
MRIRLSLMFSIALILASAAAARAQQSVQTVKDLYAAAAYEDALAVVDRLETGGQPEIEQYRVFTLTALGRKEEAQKVMERLILADPTYVLNPAETPPRVQEAFDAVRQRMLPTVAKQLYLEARASLERKDREEAIARFEKLRNIIDAGGAAAASVGDLRILADGFLDLSRALPVPAPPPAPTPVVDQPVAEAPQAPPTETRPVPIKQAMPAWVPPDAAARRGAYTGIVRVLIGPDGRVEGAEITEPSHPLYDAALLRAARAWQYEPATRNGVAIGSELNVEVNLRPPQE